MTFRPISALLLATGMLLSACMASGDTGAAKDAAAKAAQSDPQFENIRVLAEQRLSHSIEDGNTIHVVSVRKTPYLGLFEVVTADHKLLYTDEKVEYMISGHIFDMKNLTDVTDARLEEISAIALDSLPLDLAIKTVKGNGKRRVVVFSDTDCPYCRKLESEFENVTDVTIYTFIYPIEDLHPNAPEHSRRLWCAADRGKAWRDYWAKSVLPEPRDCDASGLDKIQKLALAHGIRATPTLVFADGKVNPGALPAAQLERKLGAR